MLDVLRRGARGWVAKLLLILLVAAFGVWGISGSMFNDAGNSVVTVGDTTVTPTEYRLAYDRQVAELSRQLNTRLTSEQARAFGVQQRVFGELVAGAVLDEQARQMNLGLSDDRLARLVAEDPAFHDFNGRFDRAAFARVLGSVGMSEADYIKSRSRVAVRAQIVEAVADGFTAPETLMKALARHQLATRDLEFLLLTRDIVPPLETPDDQTIQSYYEDNKQNYEAPEYRKISYVKLEPEDIADPEAVAEDVVRQEYEANTAKYATAETRTLDQLTFPDRAAADAAAARLAEGASFDEIAQDQGKSASDVRIGTFTRENAPSRAISEAAFSVGEAGGTTGVVDGPFGPVVIRVAEIAPESARPYEEVAAELRREIALTEAYDQILNVHDALEDALAGGMSIAEAARSQKLEVVTVDAVDRSARRPDGTVIDDIPASRDLLAGAFEADPGVELPPINLGTDGFVWYQVEDVIPERQRPLEEVRDQVIADWRAAETEKTLHERASELADRLRNGDSLADIAAELGLSVEQKYQLKRASEDSIFGQSAVTAAFGGPEGHSGAAPDASGENRILFKVTSVNDADDVTVDTVPADQQKLLSDGTADDMLDQMIAGLRDRYGVSIDQALAERATSF